MFYGTVSSYIEFPNNGGLDTQFSITLTCWVQPGGQDGPLFSYGVSGDTHCIKIERGKFVYRIAVKQSSSSVAVWTVIPTEVLPAGKWVHVAASYDYSSGNNSVYMDGHLRASRKGYPGHGIANAFQRVRMGAKDQFNEYFIGKIAEMKVYDVALNKEQIQTLIRQGSCTFPEIFFLSSSMISSINKTPVIGEVCKR